MVQRAELSLPEALVFVERTMRDAVKSMPQIQPAVASVLQRTGSDIPVLGKETEVAIFGVLVMALVYSDKCGALVLTLTQPSARAFFEKRLFASKKGAPTAEKVATRCGKQLLLVGSNTNENAIAEALNDPDTIPVLDADGFQRLNRLPTFVPGYQDKRSWWQRKFSSRVPPHLWTPVGVGRSKLNCVVKVADGTVSLDNAAGPLQISTSVGIWGERHGRRGLMY